MLHVCICLHVRSREFVCLRWNPTHDQFLCRVQSSFYTSVSQPTLVVPAYVNFFTTTYVPKSSLRRVHITLSIGCRAEASCDGDTQKKANSPQDATEISTKFAFSPASAELDCNGKGKMNLIFVERTDDFSLRFASPLPSNQVLSLKLLETADLMMSLASNLFIGQLLPPATSFGGVPSSERTPASRRAVRQDEREEEEALLHEAEPRTNFERSVSLPLPLLALSSPSSFLPFSLPPPISAFSSSPPPIPLSHPPPPLSRCGDDQKYTIKGVLG